MWRKRNKVYVVGTGRCGTASLAEKLGGLHEPDPDIIHESAQFYLGNPQILPDLIEKLKERRKLDAPTIADNRQSLVIPIIRQVDPASKFILLVREPTACIESFYARGAYSEDDSSKSEDKWVANRPKPLTGFPQHWTAFMKCTWRWVEVHRTIFNAIGHPELSIIFTEEIDGEVHNKSRQEQSEYLQKKRKQGLTVEEKKFFNDNALPMWDNIKKLRD